MSQTKGFWFIIEGGDGYGKTVQVQLLKASLFRWGYPIELKDVREPGGTVVGEKVRSFLDNKEFNDFRSPESQVLGYNFARAILINSVIKPLLESGQVIIADRSWLSTIAYQCFAEGMNLKSVINICEFALSELRPDHIFILDVSVEEAMRRIQVRQESLSYYDEKSIEFHQKIQEGYRWAANRYSDIVSVINGEDTIPNIAAEIEAKTLSILER